MVTTEEVLTEFLNALGAAGPHIRERASALADQIRSSSEVEVQPQSQETFESGFAFYKARPDKGFSLTDCISMLAMRSRGLTEVLTHDHHFEQEGFVVLLRA
jgi:predicted nucleic acid-binding protein